MLGGLALGLALSGALRWGPRFRKIRPFLIGAGLNLAAAALLGAILASGSEDGGLAARWVGWGLPAGVAGLLGLVAFRFPRSVGLPLALATAAGLWLVAGALQSYQPLGPSTDFPRVQPLSDREVVTAFALRADFLEAPLALPGLPHALARFRGGDTEPGEWWWAWAQSRGWARSVGVPAPDRPLKYGVYRLTLVDGQPRWRLEHPELLVPMDTPSP